MRTLVGGGLTLVMAVLLVGCPEGDGRDAGTDAGGTDAAVQPPCTTDSHCNDLNACTDDFCLPDDPDADEEGCIYVVDDTNEIPTLPNDCLRELCVKGVLSTEPDDTESPGFNLPGDCVVDVCMGGVAATVDDDTEAPLPDGLPCTADSCSAGGPVYTLLADGTACEDDPGTPEICLGGVCVASSCGDGVLSFPEVCDPGAPVAGDQCNNNCQQPPAVFGINDLGAAPAPITVAGASAGDGLGGVGALAVGDVSGDGVDDVVMGAPGAGSVYVVLGISVVQGTWPSLLDLAAGAADVQIDLPPGVVLTALTTGDVTGDGFGDVVIGAAGADGGAGAGSGIVWVVAGEDFSAPGATSDFDLALGDYHLEITPGSAGDALGASVVVGNVAGNGVGDLIIGAPGGDGPGDTIMDAGDAYVFVGGGFLVGASLSVTAADALLHGEVAGDAFGASLATGDLGGSAMADVLVGATGFDASGGTAIDAGAAFAFFGGALAMSVGAAAADVTFEGDAGDALGASVAIADFNGDSAGDVLLGAPDGDTFGNANPDEGDAYALWGPFTGGSVLQATVEVLPEFFGDGAELYGEGAAFGAVVAGGDLNDDGFDDLYVADSSGCSTGTCLVDSGELYVFLGRSFTTPGSLGGQTRLDVRSNLYTLLVRGAAAGDLLGSSFAVGDLDADGLADFAVGIPGSDTSGGVRPDAGEVVIFLGGVNTTPP